MKSILLAFTLLMGNNAHSQGALIGNGGNIFVCPNPVRFTRPDGSTVQLGNAFTVDTWIGSYDLDYETIPGNTLLEKAVAHAGSISRLDPKLGNRILSFMTEAILLMNAQGTGMGTLPRNPNQAPLLRERHPFEQLSVTGDFSLRTQPIGCTMQPVLNQYQSHRGNESLLVIDFANFNLLSDDEKIRILSHEAFVQISRAAGKIRMDGAIVMNSFVASNRMKSASHCEYITELKQYEVWNLDLNGKNFEISNVSCTQNGPIQGAWHMEIIGNPIAQGISPFFFGSNHPLNSEGQIDGIAKVEIYNRSWNLVIDRASNKIIGISEPYPLSEKCSSEWQCLFMTTAATLVENQNETYSLVNGETRITFRSNGDVVLVEKSQSNGVGKVFPNFTLSKSITDKTELLLACIRDTLIYSPINSDQNAFATELLTKLIAEKETLTSTADLNSFEENQDQLLNQCKAYPAKRNAMYFAHVFKSKRNYKINGDYVITETKSNAYNFLVGKKHVQISRMLRLLSKNELDCAPSGLQQTTAGFLVGITIQVGTLLCRSKSGLVRKYAGVVPNVGLCKVGVGSAWSEGNSFRLQGKMLGLHGEVLYTSTADGLSMVGVKSVNIDSGGHGIEDGRGFGLLWDLGLTAAVVPGMFLVKKLPDEMTELMTTFYQGK